MCVGALVLIPKRLLDGAVAVHAAQLTLSGIVAALIGLGVLTPLMTAVPIIVALAIAGACSSVMYLAGALVLRAITWDDVQPLLARVHEGRQ
jgi:hypothetical protein